MRARADALEVYTILHRRYDRDDRLQAKILQVAMDNITMGDVLLEMMGINLNAHKHPTPKHVTTITPKTAEAAE